MMKDKLVNNAKNIDKFLLNFLNKQENSLLVPPMKYGVISGGKKIRSTIIFDTGKLLNVKKKNFTIMCSSRVHTFLLINS